MKLISIFLLFLFTSVIHAGAQLTVCEVHGSVEYKQGGEWKKIDKQQVSIPDNSPLKFGAKSSCIVAQGERSKLYSSEKAGEITVRSGELEEASILDKLWAVIGGFLSEPSTSGGAAIFRGENLMLLPADGEVLLSPSFHYVWRSNNSLSYDFFLQDDATGAWLCNNVKIKDTSLKAQGNASCNKTLAAGKTYYWGVKPSSNTSEECYLVGFSLASPAVKSALDKKLADLQKNKAMVDEDVYEVLVADVYAGMHMYTQAYNTLVAAAGRFPASQVIRSAREVFLKGLTDINSETHDNSGK